MGTRVGGLGWAALCAATWGRQGHASLSTVWHLDPGFPKVGVGACQHVPGLARAIKSFGDTRLPFPSSSSPGGAANSSHASFISHLALGNSCFPQEERREVKGLSLIHI